MKKSKLLSKIEVRQLLFGLASKARMHGITKEAWEVHIYSRASDLVLTIGETEFHHLKELAWNGMR